jgi:hypothetical protein
MDWRDEKQVLDNIAYILIITCVAMVVLEMIWLYYLSVKNEAANRRERKAGVEIKARVNAIINSPTKASRRQEVSDLKDYIRSNRTKMDILSENLSGMLSGDDVSLMDERQRSFYLIFTYIKPVDFYLDLLRNGNIYDKSFACRMLSDFFAESEIPKIRKHITSKNKELTYNAALTLSSLGDEEGVMAAIRKFADNHELSHRVTVELLEEYTGDMNQLARKLLGNSNEYIKASVVKALAKYRLGDLAPTYGRYLIDGGKNLKIAAIKALGELGNVEFEHELIVASRSTEWEIRSAAVKALRNTVTTNTLEAVARSTKDSQWWVRYNAANSLVLMDQSRIYVNRILHDYDKYAIEVVRNALYHDTSKGTQLRGVV